MNFNGGFLTVNFDDFIGLIKGKGAQLGSRVPPKIEKIGLNPFLIVT